MKEHHFSESLTEALKKSQEYALSHKYEYLTIDNVMLLFVTLHMEKNYLKL